MNATLLVEKQLFYATTVAKQIFYATAVAETTHTKI